MVTRTFKTNLRCGGCVASLKPILDADPLITAWEADVASPDKLLHVTGEQATKAHMQAKLAEAGYAITAEVAPKLTLPIMQDTPANEPKPNYWPLLLILGYLLLACGLHEIATGYFSLPRAMRYFMGGFFLVFSFFKFLDLAAFATSYAMYDLLAARSRLYGYIYPFLELWLAINYLGDYFPLFTNIFTLVLMTFGTLGVVRSMRSGKKVRCACLGAVINLPVSVVTLTEDLLMATMAAVMLLM